MLGQRASLESYAKLTDLACRVYIATRSRQTRAELYRPWTPDKKADDVTLAGSPVRIAAISDARDDGFTRRFGHQDVQASFSKAAMIADAHLRPPFGARRSSWIPQTKNYVPDYPTLGVLE